MAAAFSVVSAEIAFFLQCDHACFDCVLRFTDCCSKFFLCDRRICGDCAKHGQLFQSAIQSAIFALWNFSVGTLNRSFAFILHMEIAIFQFMLRAEEQVFKNISRNSLLAWIMFLLLFQGKKIRTRSLFLFKKSLRNLRAHLCITPVIRASFTVFS